MDRSEALHACLRHSLDRPISWMHRFVSQRSGRSPASIRLQRENLDASSPGSQAAHTLNILHAVRARTCMFEVQCSPANERLCRTSCKACMTCTVSATYACNREAASTSAESLLHVAAASTRSLSSRFHRPCAKDCLTCHLVAIPHLQRDDVRTSERLFSQQFPPVLGLNVELLDCLAGRGGKGVEVRRRNSQE